MSPRGYKILVEAIGTHQSAARAEVGYVFLVRRKGDSKANLRVYWEYLLHLLRLRFGSTAGAPLPVEQCSGGSGTSARSGRSRSWKTMNPENTASHNSHAVMRQVALLLLLTALAMLIQGYHAGWEDDAVYLPAIKKDINPHLYPHDSDFFQIQLQAQISISSLPAVIQLSGIALPWGVFVWQFASIFLILYGCWQ